MLKNSLFSDKLDKRGHLLTLGRKGTAYLYRGDSLVVPCNTPDSRIQEEMSLDLIEAAFGGTCVTDSFSVPGLDGQEEINFVSLNDTELPPEWKAIPVRQAINIIAGGNIADGYGVIGRIFRSYHINLWRKDSLFCGHCGAANQDAGSPDTSGASGLPVLARQCPSCGRLEFPRIAPAVITLITNERGEALLAHNIKFASGIYSLIAGFNEAGEDLESTAVREIKEEVNLDVDNICYIRSQPWPFPNSLMVGFSARLKGGKLKPDGIEIDDARWFSRDKLPNLPGNGSVSRYLINLWQEGKL